MPEQAQAASEVANESSDNIEQIAGLLDDDGLLAGETAEEADPDEEQDARPEPPTQNTAPEVEGDDQTTESDADQTVEVEYEGAKYRLPPEIKDALLRRADYTRKTQEVASERAAAQQERQVAQRLVQEAQQFVGQYAAINQIDQQLQQFQKVDWQQLARDDPFQHLQSRQAVSELMAARQALLGQLEQQRQHTQSQQLQALRAAYEVVSKDIPNWGPDVQAGLRATANAVGYTADEVATISDPRAIKLLHKAYLYDQLQQRKSQTAKQIAKAPPKPVRPGASQGPGSVNVPNEALRRLKKSGSEADAVAALLHLGLD